MKFSKQGNRLLNASASVIRRIRRLRVVVAIVSTSPKILLQEGVAWFPRNVAKVVAPAEFPGGLLEVGYSAAGCSAALSVSVA